MCVIHTFQCQGELASPPPSPPETVISVKVTTIACGWLEERFAFAPPLGKELEWKIVSVE